MGDADELRSRELLAAALGAIALAVITTWPLVLHLRTHIGGDAGDPLLQAWQVAWNGHALLHQPLHWFDANTFWPLSNSLALSDALIGYTPAALIGSGLEAAVIRYDLLVIFAQALAFAGPYLLGRELGLNRSGAVVTAVAFGLAPFRIHQLGHLHVFSSGGIPLCLFFLIRGYRRGSWWQTLIGWVTAAWQVSLGFSLGIQLLTLLVVLGALALIKGWRPPLLITAVGIAILAVTTIVLALPYLEVQELVGARTAGEVAGYSPPIWGFLAAPEPDLVWGAMTGPVRSSLGSAEEMCLFPGVAVLILAAMRSVFTPAFRRGLALGLAACVILSLGVNFGTPDASPYGLLAHLPGWSSVRTPGRIMTIGSLLLALLAGGAATRLPTRIAVVAALVIALEGLGHGIQARAPLEAAAAPEPQLHLPSNDYADRVYMFQSIAGFPRVANGASGYPSEMLATLRERTADFPSRRSMRVLRAAGIRSVVLHAGDDVRTPLRVIRMR